MNQFRNYLTIAREDEDEWICHCPLHDDRKPSFTIRTKDQVFNCFSCGISGKGFVQFFAILNGIPASYAKKLIETPPKLIPDKAVDQPHQKLLLAKEALQKIKEERGLSIEQIKKFKLGIDRDRITIPIEGINGYENLRRHTKGGTTESYEEGYGSVRLFPLRNRGLNPIILFEGELDTILADQLGLPAMTFTGGAGVLSKSQLCFFKDKRVYICYDIDKPGKRGAAKVAEALIDLAESVEIINLPITDPPDGDFADFILKHNGKASDLLSFSSKEAEEEVISLSDIDKVPISKRFRCKGHLRGKSSHPFIWLKRVRLVCSLSESNRALKICKGCPLVENGGLSIKLEKEMLLTEGIEASPKDLQKVVESRSGVFFPSCVRRFMRVLDSQPLWKVNLVPAFELSSLSGDVTDKTGYIIENRESIRGNTPYLLTGRRLIHPRNGLAYPLFFDAMPLKTSLDEFKLSSEDIEELSKYFQSANVREKLNQITSDLACNVCRVYQRDRALLAMDLAYHSALSFRIGRKRVPKGYIDLLLIGDTRTGKSEIARTLSEFYGMGEIVTGENASYAGLVGGVGDIHGAERFISWGKLPLNDKKLVVIDEANDMPEDVIPRLSGIRSSGIAEIVKIKTEKTLARVRILWIANPPNGLSLSSFPYGVSAGIEFMKKEEDLARLDLVIGVAGDNISAEELNKWAVSSSTTDRVVDRELFRKLLLWVWSRKESQIKFKSSAISSLLQSTKALEKLYNCSVKIMSGPEGITKLAKFSVAMAGRLFSTNDGETLIVEEQHVIAARDFIIECLNDRSLSFDLYANYQRSKGIAWDEETAIQAKAQVIDLFNRLNFPTWGIEKFLLGEAFNFWWAKSIFQLPVIATEQLLSELTKLGCLRYTQKGGYLCTRPFIYILNDLKENGYEKTSEEY